MTDHYSNIMLEQYVLNELSTDDKLKLQNDLANNETLRKRIDAIRHSNTEIESSYDENEMVREINLRIHTRKIQNERQQTKAPKITSSWQRLGYVMPIVAIVAVSFLIVQESNQISPTSNLEVSEDGIRLKGLQPHINIYQQVEDGVQQLEEGAIASQGDSLQLSYVAAGQLFGIIFSIDGRGVLTQHYPLDNQSALRLNVSGEFMVERSYQLDDAPKFEHFFFITSKEHFSLQEVIRIAKNNSALINENTKSITGLPAYLNQYVLTIKKAE